MLTFIKKTKSIIGFPLMNKGTKYFKRRKKVNNLYRVIN